MTTVCTDPDRTKRAAFEDLLEHGIVILHLDARAADVRVPPWLRDRSWLVLNFSLRFHVEDFVFDELAVKAALSFRGTPQSCLIPWSAVFAMGSQVRDELHIWRQDVPREHADEFAEKNADSPLTGPSPLVPLRVVKGGRSEDHSPSDRKTGHLRSIK
jgi:stringent starvation protein B